MANFIGIITPPTPSKGILLHINSGGQDSLWKLKLTSIFFSCDARQNLGERQIAAYWFESCIWMLPSKMLFICVP